MKFFDASRYASPLRKALAKKENAPRNLRFETLENRALLSVTPLDELQAAVASAEIAPAYTVETPVVDLSALAVSNATTATDANDDQYEENDALAAATPLGVLTETTTLEGIAAPQVDNVPENDWYSFTTTYTGTDDHSIVLKFDSAYRNHIYVFLKNADETTSIGGAWDAEAGAKVISLQGVETGAYSIQIYSRHSSAYIPYTLTIEPPKPKTDDVYEANDSLDAATDLGMIGPSTLEATVGPNANADFYKFTLVDDGTEADYLKLDYTDTSSVLMNVTIYDQQKKPILTNVNKWTSNKIETFSLAGQKAGDYYVEIVTNQKVAGFSDYTLSFVAPTTAPAAPTNFDASGDKVETEDGTTLFLANEATLSWDAVAHITGYEVRYSSDDGKTWTTETLAPNQTSFDLTELAYATEYLCQVRAVRISDGFYAWNVASEWEDSALKFTTVAAPVAPELAQPELTLETFKPSEQKIELTWTNVAYERGYVVQTRDANGAWVDASERLAADTTTWTTDKLELGATYDYRVVAFNNAGETASEVVDFTTPNVPAPPSGLTVAEQPSETPSAKLTWKAATETGIEAVVDYAVTVYRETVDAETGETTFAAVSTQTVETATATVEGLVQGETYYFEVVARNAYGASAASQQEKLTVGDVPNQAAKNLTVELVAAPKPFATITWDVVAGATSYDVVVLDAAGQPVYQIDAYQLADVEVLTLTLPATVDADDPDSAALFNLGENYVCSVYARNVYGRSEVAATQDFTIGNVPVRPALTATVAPSTTAPTATLAWNKVDAATVYVVEQLVVDGETATWTAVQTLENGETEWTTAVEANAAYSYRVVAANAYGSGVPSEAVAFTPDAASTVVTTLADEVDPSDGEISLREAIQYAEVGATVTFAETLKGETLKLGGVCLQIDKAITIDGSFETGAPQITIDADAKSRVFNVEAGTADAPVKLVGLTITNGYADVVDDRRQYGGGIRVGANAALDVANSKIVGNRSTERGGGVYLNAGSTGNFTNVEITGNAGAFYGGGVAVGSNASATFRNSTVIGLSNLSNQVGIDVDANSGAVKFYNSIVRYVGARQETQTLEAYNTASDFADWTNADEEGVVNYVIDETLPLFTNAENGDYTLADGSQALNKGDNAYVPETLTTDLAGNPRLSGRVDLGAYEFQGVATTAPTGLTATVNPSTAPTATLKWDAVVSDAIAETVAGYEVSLYQIEADGTVVAFAPQTVTDATYTTETLDFGGTYYFEVAAVNAYGKSEVAKSAPFTVGTVPTQPTDLEYEFNHYANNAILTWTAVEGAASYVVEQLGADGEWAPVAPPVGNPETTETTWESGAFDFGTSRAFRVVAKNAYGSSVASDAVSFTIQDAPTVVTSLEDGDLNLLDGVTTLREALRFAQDGDEIVFAEDLRGGKITLTGGPLIIMGKEISVNGFVDETGAPELTIDGDHKDMIFVVSNTRASFFGLSVVNGYASYAKYGGDARGGGFSVDHANATFTNVDVIGCHADVYGGGIYIGSNVEIPGQGKSTLTNVRILDNASDDGESSGLGGGLYATGGFMGGEIEMTNVEISGNQARVDGGGVFLNDITSTLTNVKITDNIAQGNGGAFYANAPDHTSVSTSNGYPLLLISTKLTNVEITGNQAYQGFGFYADEFDVEELSLRNVTLADNAGTQEGASADVYLANGAATFYNSIVGGDVQGEEYAANAYNTLSSFTGWANADEEGVVNYVLNEGDSVFAKGSHALAADSVALNKGDNAYVPETITTDLAGNPRFFNGTVDLGAYEAGEDPSTVVTTAEDVVNAYDDQISLREALAYAKSGQTVSFDANLKGATIKLAGEELTIDKPLTIQGLVDETGAPQITIDADGKSRVLYVVAGVASKPVSISGLKLTGGYATYGGGVYLAYGSTVNFANAQIIDNEAQLGGGVYVYSGASATLTDATTVSGNEAAIHGAGLYVAGKATLTGATISDNKAAASGGGVMINSTGDATLNGETTVSGNEAKRGAGVFVSGAAKLDGVGVSGNKAQESGGGVYVYATGDATLTDAAVNANFGEIGAGVYVHTNGAATVTGGEISYNGDDATKYGGGVCVRAGGEASFSGAAITENNAQLGGGVYVYSGASATLTDATTVSGNEAAIHGAGLYVAGKATLTGATVSNNNALESGGGVMIHSTGDATLNGETTVSGNEAKRGAGVFVSGAAELDAVDVSGNKAQESGGGVYVYATGDATITNAIFSANEAYSGGGLFVTQNGTATLTGVEFSGNAATQTGGGAFVDGEATFDNAIFDANKAYSGGGVYVRVNGAATFENATISANQARSGGGVAVAGTATFTGGTISYNANGENASETGGGVCVTAGGEASFSGVAITGNNAQLGGGVYVYADGAATLTDATTVSENEASIHGGGLYFAGSGTLANAVVSGNSALESGGGVFVKSTVETTLTNATISGNEAKRGAGVFVSNNANATLANVEISGNDATQFGGGVYVYTTGKATLTNATIAGNKAANASGAYVVGTLELRNSIVVDSVVNKDGVANAYNTLSGFAAWSNAATDNATQFVYNAEEPLFATGGYTLAENSQALDKGNDEYAVAADGSALATDLAGAARIVGSSVDLGAYESQSEVVSAAFAESLDDLDFFVDEDDLDALAKRLV